MNYNYFVGIDISRDTFSFAIINKNANIIKQDSFSQTYSDYTKFISFLHNIAPLEQIIIALESTGNYHINLLSFLVSNSYNTILINPLLLKNFKNFTTLRKTKTDKIDALSIAKFILKYPENLKPFIPDQSSKLIAREREEVSKQIARTKTKIKGLVFNIFKELGDITDVLNKKMLEFLLLVPSARIARKLGKKEVKRKLNLAFKGRGKRPNITPDDIMSIAHNTISINDIEREIVLQSLIRRLFALMEEEDTLTNALLERIKFFRPREMNILTSIPGVGETSAAIFLSEIQNIFRFQSPKKLTAYMGLDPSILQSGKFKGKSRISKRGNPHIRRIMWSMTVGVVFRVPFFEDYYRRKRREGFSHKKAVIATSHKLISMLYSLLTHQRLFQLTPPLQTRITHS